MAQLCRRKGLCIFAPYRTLLTNCTRTTSSSFCSSSLIPSPHARITSSQVDLVAARFPWIWMKRESQSSEGMAASYFFSRRSSYSTAATSTTDSDYPPPTPPQEFSGSDVAEESLEGADLNVADDAEAMNDPSMYNVDGNYGDAEEEEGEYEEEEPAPDPEAEALFSPAEED